MKIVLYAAMSEWLKSLTRNQVGSARTGSNAARRAVDFWYCNRDKNKTCGTCQWLFSLKFLLLLFEETCVFGIKQVVKNDILVISRDAVKRVNRQTCRSNHPLERPYPAYGWGVVHKTHNSVFKVLLKRAVLNCLLKHF